MSEENQQTASVENKKSGKVKKISKEAYQKYITFSLGEEEYGIPVLQVLEIVKIRDIIQIPHSLNYFLGYMDIRGTVIALIDLKKKLDIYATGEETATVLDRAIIIQAQGQRIGLAVDRVSHVIRIPPENIDSGPPTIKSASNRFISGVGKYRDQFIVLMNLDNLFTNEEINFIFTSPSER
jgi:purine-binding chemotaxis protein CheW